MSNKTCMRSLKPANSFFYFSNTRTFLTLFCTVKLESIDIKKYLWHIEYMVLAVNTVMKGRQQYSVR